MKTLRNSRILKNLIWLILFTSHINIALANVTSLNENKRSSFYAGECLFVSSADFAFGADKAKSEKSFSIQLLICFIFAGSCFYSQNIIPAFRYLSGLYSRVIRVFCFSPTYLFYRVLII